MAGFSTARANTLAFLLSILTFNTLDIHALENNRGKSPTMGWISSVAFKCSIDENSMHKQIDLMDSTGLRTSFYRTFILGCGWQGTRRDSGQEFPINPRFPAGMSGFSKYVHDHHLELGLTSSAGNYACGSGKREKHKKLGSQGHIPEDVKSFAGWGVDFLRIEFCYLGKRHVEYAPGLDLKVPTGQFRDAIHSTRQMTLAIDAWGIQNPVKWPIEKYANLWRIGGEVGEGNIWSNIVRTINQFVGVSQYNKPGIFADLDLLMIGYPELTDAEAVTQFTFWAAAKSPLIICQDLAKLSKNELNVLRNGFLIGVNQDLMTPSIRLKRRYTDEFDIWTTPLSDNSTLVVLINFQDTLKDVTFKLEDVGFSGARARDVWADNDLGAFTFPIVTTIAPHGVTVLQLNETTSSPAIKYNNYPAIGPQSKLYYKAVQRTTQSGVKVASNIGRGSFIEWFDIDGGEKGGSKRITLDYIMADNELFAKTNCPRCRNAWISVNEKPAKMFNFPSTGDSWDDVHNGYMLELDGFAAGKTNKLKIENEHDVAPDFASVNIQSD